MSPMPFRRRSMTAGLLSLAAAPALPRATMGQERPLRVVSPWAFETADPLEKGYVLNRLGIGETLVGVAPDGALVGRLAESWAVDADRLTWRIRLRRARFHDGSPVLAPHVAAHARAGAVEG